MDMKVFEKVMNIKTVVTTRVFAKSHTFIIKLPQFYDKSETAQVKASSVRKVGGK